MAADTAARGKAPDKAAQDKGARSTAAGAAAGAGTARNGATPGKPAPDRPARQAADRKTPDRQAADRTPPERPEGKAPGRPDRKAGEGARIARLPAGRDGAGAEVPRALEGRMAPPWLAEMRTATTGGTRVDRPRGFYVNYQNFAAVHVDRGGDTLIVTFDNLSAVNDPSLERTAWGDKFLAENGWSSLGILAFQANWYRDEVLFDYLESLRDQGFFARFRHVVFTGTSMGGYAATAFCGLAPGSVVIAYSPQSTLKKELVPWEKRFNRGRMQDWSGRYADGAVESRAASRVYLCYDPWMAPDKAHADRFTGDNVVRLHTNYVGHKNVVFLRRAGILKAVMGQCITGEMTEARFHRLYRARRRLPWYYMGLLDMTLARGRPDLAERIIRGAAAASGLRNLPNALRRRRDQFLEESSAKAGSDPARPAGAGAARRTAAG